MPESTTIEEDFFSEKYLFQNHNVSFTKDILTSDISGQLPYGDDLRNKSSNYYDKYTEIKNLRNSLRKQELINLQESATVIRPEKWTPIIDTCVECLSKATKDIEILCWLNEGLTRLYGVQGLIFGFDIFSALVKKYSSNLYPHKDEGEDEEDRLSSISILNGQRDVGSLVIAIYMMPLFFNKDDEGSSAWQIKMMLEADKLSGLDASFNNLSKSNNVRTFISSINKTKLLETKKLCDHAYKMFHNFNSTLSGIFSTSAPNIQNINKVLSYVQNLVSSIAELLDENAGPTNSKDEANNQEFNFQEVTNLNRQKAIRSLEQLSSFFENSDPHSPATYLLKKSVKWFKGNLENIIADILDDDERLKYCKITGVPFVRKDRNDEYGD